MTEHQLQSNEIIEFENWSSGDLSKIGHSFLNFRKLSDL